MCRWKGMVSIKPLGGLRNDNTPKNKDTLDLTVKVLAILIYFFVNQIVSAVNHSASHRSLFVGSQVRMSMSMPSFPSYTHTVSLEVLLKILPRMKNKCSKRFLALIVFRTMPRQNFTLRGCWRQRILSSVVQIDQRLPLVHVSQSVFYLPSLPWLPNSWWDLRGLRQWGKKMQ